MNKEPETDSELEEALEKLGVEVIDTGSGFVMRNKKLGGQTRLESDPDDLSSALYEAWGLSHP